MLLTLAFAPLKQSIFSMAYCSDWSQKSDPYVCRECITLRTQWWTLPFSRLREHEHDDTVYIVVRRDGMLTFGGDMIEDVSPLFFCWVCFCWVHRRCLAVQFFRWVVLLFLFRMIEDVLLFLTAADRIGHQHRDGLADSRGRRPDQVEQWPSWVAKANAINHHKPTLWG